MGAPFGNHNAAKGRRWAKAVERAVDAWPERAVSLEVNKGIDNMAWEFVREMVTTKDIAFFREFGDRIDGKAVQASEISGPDGGALQLRGVISLVKPDGDGEGA